METKSLGAVLKAAVSAGLIAGAVAAGFHSLVTEPIIDRAIQIEEKLKVATGGTTEEPIVSRGTQKAGLVFGLLLYGAIWGLLLGVFFYLTNSGQPAAWSITKRGFFLVLLMGWAVALFPFLKYPANPPGVGEAETIAYRQWLYLGFMALSVIGTTLALKFQRLMSQRKRSAWLIVLPLYTLYFAVIYLAMPYNPDPVGMSPEIIRTFRAFSLAGLVLFWAVMAGAFGWLCQERKGAP
jgi:uncharacterized membrane protein (DUF485 family)